MVRVLNIIESISLGGAARGVFGTAKYSSLQGEYRHSIVSLAPHKDDPAACRLAAQNGLELLCPTNYDQLLQLIAQSDITLLQWWNSPEMDNLIRTKLPPCRLAAWVHVGGHQDPQRVPNNLLPFLDFAIAGSPYTYESDAFRLLEPTLRAHKTSMIYDATDFARLSNVGKTPHTGFNVGYIGTVDFSKMHRHYVRMSAAASIPAVRFIVCGPGSDQETLRTEARALGRQSEFEIKGMLEDITPVLSILDAYGYPLCEDNYAAAELNLQEVMFCGIPPVVFPYGGVRHLIVNDFTGYIVHSETEYAEALEHLYRNPAERERIGRNAAEYARQIFGSEHAARRFNPALDMIMRTEKHGRQPFVVERDTALPTLAALPLGATRFIESLSQAKQPFVASMQSADLAATLSADQAIMSSTALMKRVGIKSYRHFHATDPYLCFWSGLVSIHDGALVEGLTELVEAIKYNFPHWRPWWYIAQAAHKLGQLDVAKLSLAQVLTHAPEFVAARELGVRLKA